MKITDEQREIVNKFMVLYGGGLAQSLRDVGQQNAMPPWAETVWMGRQISKCPMDLWVYQEILWERRPQLVIECGTGGGGSAWFFAHIMDAMGVGRVVTVDTMNYPHLYHLHSRIKYLTGSSVSEEIAEVLRREAKGSSTMLVLDSLHTYGQVKQELSLYGMLVTVGQYLVVEDTGLGGSAVGSGGASEAAGEFLEQTQMFQVDKSREKHLLTLNRDGWLLRVK